MAYQAPKLTKYGKISNFIQAGSVIASGDVTGDGTADFLIDLNGDGIGDVVIGGANGGVTPVNFVGQTGPFNLYDADGDGEAGIVVPGNSGNLINAPVGLPGTEPSPLDGWLNPNRD